MSSDTSPPTRPGQAQQDTVADHAYLILMHPPGANASAGLGAGIVFDEGTAAQVAERLSEQRQHPQMEWQYIPLTQLDDSYLETVRVDHTRQRKVAEAVADVQAPHSDQ